ncbi:hypothetical protein RED65_07979 [Oceanobacter sp. RED65]|uniref:Uncharacterized protein n=1 Tax=Bermanella marisrubri TaxID=207949 RepID=Q1N0A6_9GAMM|nr:hypothetical protein RED65_07979 [Oceanobacter sp. RED65] [Bermanella marisrubri]
MELERSKPLAFFGDDGWFSDFSGDAGSDMKLITYDFSLWAT